MSSIFKKAMGLFVEFENSRQPAPAAKTSVSFQSTTSSPPVLNPEELDKFELHFEKMFEQANLPGPDYYEFWKMSETLEVHIKDEPARMSATYASLSIQGLTKEKLIGSAMKYKELIEHDRAQFEKAAQEKSEKEIGHKRSELQAMEETTAQHAEMIKKLTKEISDMQGGMNALRLSITEEENKLAKNMRGYTVACDAMTKKIEEDVKKIQTTL